MTDDMQVCSFQPPKKHAIKNKHGIIFLGDKVVVNESGNKKPWEGWLIGYDLAADKKVCSAKVQKNVFCVVDLVTEVKSLVVECDVDCLFPTM